MYGGVSWWSAPETASTMYAVFPIVLQLVEMLYYLEEARGRSEALGLFGEMK
jgi:hypothetical protein